jgi:hypothetical protein
VNGFAVLLVTVVLSAPGSSRAAIVPAHA